MYVPTITVYVLTTSVTYSQPPTVCMCSPPLCTCSQPPCACSQPLCSQRAYSRCQAHSQCVGLYVYKHCVHARGHCVRAHNLCYILTTTQRVYVLTITVYLLTTTVCVLTSTVYVCSRPVCACPQPLCSQRAYNHCQAHNQCVGLYVYNHCVHARDHWVTYTRSPRPHLHVVGMLRVHVFDTNQPSLPAPFFFYSVLVSMTVFMALSTVFHSINSPDNSPLSHPVLPVLFLFYWSFQL